MVALGSKSIPWFEMLAMMMPMGLALSMNEAFASEPDPQTTTSGIGSPAPCTNHRSPKTIIGINRGYGAYPIYFCKAVAFISL